MCRPMICILYRSLCLRLCFNICLWDSMCSVRCKVWKVWMNSDNLLLLWLCQTNCSLETGFKLIWFWERFADTNYWTSTQWEINGTYVAYLATGSQFLINSLIFNYNSRLRCYTFNHIINCSFHTKMDMGL